MFAPSVSWRAGAGDTAGCLQPNAYKMANKTHKRAMSITRQSYTGALDLAKLGGAYSEVSWLREAYKCIQNVEAT